MNSKSILVDVDETTSALLKSVNSDLTSEVTIGVEDALARFKNQLSSLLDELKGQVSKSQQEAQNDNRRLSQLAKDQLDRIDDIEDILENLEGLDNIREVTTKLGNTINTLTEGFSSIKDEINHTGDGLRSDLKYQISLSADDLKAQLKDILKKSESETSEILRYAENGLAETKNTKKEIIQTTAEIEPKILAAFNEKVSEIEESLRDKTNYLESQVNAIASSLDIIGSAITQSNDSIRQELNQKAVEISEKLDSLITLTKQVDRQSKERDNNILSLLGRTLYQVTPFWKRNKLNESEE